MRKVMKASSVGEERNVSLSVSALSDSGMEGCLSRSCWKLVEQCYPKELAYVRGRQVDTRLRNIHGTEQTTSSAQRSCDQSTTLACLEML